MTHTPKLTPEEKTILKKLWHLQTQAGVGYKSDKGEDITIFQRLETLDLVEHAGKLWYLTVAGEKLANSLSSQSNAEKV